MTPEEVMEGSSPHTRGARQDAAGLQVRTGIIPAYAGSTIETTSGQRLPKDHPRIRGEHLAVEAVHRP